MRLNLIGLPSRRSETMASRNPGIEFAQTMPSRSRLESSYSRLASSHLVVVE